MFSSEECSDTDCPVQFLKSEDLEELKLTDCWDVLTVFIYLFCNRNGLHQKLQQLI